MGHDQDNNHYHFAGNIKAAFFINVVFTIIEFIGGIFTNSLAIMSDALHDLGDSLALGLAWYFERLSGKNQDTTFTYGYRRFSTLGAVINAVILVSGSIIILWEAVPRLAYDITSAVEIYYNEKITISNFIKFHNWVGGDRDGNPAVTHRITEYAIQVQKIRIAGKFIETLEMLYDDLSITVKDQTKIITLQNSIKADVINLNIDENIQEQNFTYQRGYRIFWQCSFASTFRFRLKRNKNIKSG